MEDAVQDSCVSDDAFPLFARGILAGAVFLLSGKERGDVFGKLLFRQAAGLEEVVHVVSVVEFLFVALALDAHRTRAIETCDLFPEAACETAVLERDDESVIFFEALEQCFVEAGGEDRVDDRDVEALLGEQGRRFLGQAEEIAEAEDGRGRGWPPGCRSG